MHFNGALEWYWKTGYFIFLLGLIRRKKGAQATWGLQGAFLDTLAQTNTLRKTSPCFIFNMSPENTVITPRSSEMSMFYSSHTTTL